MGLSYVDFGQGGIERDRSQSLSPPPFGGESGFLCMIQKLIYCNCKKCECSALGGGGREDRKGSQTFPE